jgi:hypothetical protein
MYSTTHSRLIGFAGFEAGFAGGGALLAVVVLVLGAFVVALLANFDALLHNVGRVGRVAGDESGREAADIGAVAVGANAAHHHLDSVFREAGVGAVFAGGYAAGQGIEDGAAFNRSIFHKEKGK